LKPVALLLLSLAQAGPPAQPTYDLIIRGGRIIDGSGNPWYRADVGVRAGRIEAVGNLSSARASRVVEARGRVVAPGFIDLHSHADRGLARADLRFSQAFLYQGVTTSVVGVDGGGSDDLVSASAPLVAQGIGTNLAYYVGHNAARRAVMGIEARPPTAAELEKMKAFIRRGMEKGAFGISTGLEYIPGRYSKTDEVIELSKVAASFGGIYDTHYRDEFFDMLDSIREGIEISEKAGLPVHFGHIKVIGEHNWGKMAEAVRLIDQARRRGLDITADQYPWENGAVGHLHDHLQIPPELGELFSLWRGRNRETYLPALRQALADPLSRAAIRRATEGGLEGPEYNNWIRHWGYDWFRVVRSKKHHEYLHQTIAQIAYWKATTGFDLVADLIVEEGDDLGVSIGPFSKEDVEKVMVQPWLAHSTDGTLGPLGEGFPHPRSYGSYARLIEHYVGERGLLTLEEAVRKSSSLPAQILGLRDRGLVRQGAFADLIVFDPEKVHNRSTYSDPHRYAEGFDLVIVNGAIVLEDGKLTGATPGRILRHRQPDLGPGPKPETTR
jgi:N-acyl-D-aspartate/D-glutamate deacylase